ncbi:alpha/beta hydrolase [Ilumatobacter sp.]|uniref:alpha/beta hydrolase n=1 Tax=Ilumatobacter sp. TaxID=1967498 RepID=UPI003C3CDBD0
MPLNSEARSLLDLMDAVGAPPLDSLPPVAARDARAEFAAPILERCHETVDLDADGVPVRLYRPAPADEVPGLLLWFHGGGWVLGDIASHDNICHALARRAGHAVLSVAYGLAPERPFPAALDDCIQATRWAHEHAGELGVDADRIAIGGDSAGANLATVVCHSDPPPLVFQVLVYPLTDARMTTASYDENGEGYFLTASSMRWFLDHYLSGDDGAADDPRVSPMLAADDVLSSDPPALVITAGFDPLRDEGIAYANRLADLGVATHHVHFPGQIHGFFSMPHHLGDARAALALAAQSLADALAQRDPPPA